MLIDGSDGKTEAGEVVLIRFSPIDVEYGLGLMFFSAAISRFIRAGSITQLVIGTPNWLELPSVNSVSVMYADSITAFLGISIPV